MILYDLPHSGNCYKVHLLFAHLGLKYERVDLTGVDRSKRPGILGGLNPALRTPTVVLDDGRPLAESNAILWYFADGTPFLPSDPYDRAKVLQWLFFEQYEHEPNVAVLRHWLKRKQAVSPEALEAKRAAGYAALEAMDGHLSLHPYFAGDRYSIADISLYAYTHVAPEGDFDLSRFGHIRSWLDRVASQPGHIAIGV